MKKVKILLVLEDYQEHTDMQSLLMKYGWDVKSVKRDILVKEEVFTFRPQLIIAGGKGKQVDGFKLAKMLDRKEGMPKYALYLDRQQILDKSHADLGVDEVIAKPFEPLIVLKLVCRLTGVDEAQVLEKYRKLNPGAVEESEDENQYVTGQVGEAEQKQMVSHRPQTIEGRDWINDVKRKKKYDDIVAAVKPEDMSEWKKSPVDATIAALHEKFASEYEDHDVNRQEFTNALFKD